MRHATFRLLLVALVAIAFDYPAQGQSQNERWVVIATQGIPSVPHPRSDIKVTMPPKSHAYPANGSLSGTYTISGLDLLLFLQVASGQSVPYFAGTYSILRSSKLYKFGTFTPSGPLAALGVGTASPSGATITFAPRPGVKVVFSSTPTSTSKPISLWTSTTSYVLTREVVMTTDAADELGAIISDTEHELEAEGADSAKYEHMRAGTFQLVDEAVLFAQLDGRTHVVSGDFWRAVKKLCPIYPFCRKKR